MILVSHGGLAGGMENALKMLVGKTDAVCAYGLLPGESPETIAQTIEKEVLAHSQTRFFILADLLGGSVSNAVTRLSLLPNVLIINGMNLPLVISLYFAEADVAGEELDTIFTEARDSIAPARLRSTSSVCEEDDII